MTERQVTAGTASARYKVRPVEHLYRPDTHRDPGMRPACLCGRGRAAHPDTLRTLDQQRRTT